VVGLLRIGAAAGVLRWLLMALDPGLISLFPLMALHAATFGATYLATMHFITRAAPPHLAATAQAAYAAGSGVLMGLAAGASGLLYERFAAGGFLAMAALGALALLAAARLREPATAAS
jgi:PPP family 3-phenylpropionic acid transporter